MARCLIGRPGVVGAVAFILTHLVFNSLFISFLALLVGLAADAALFASLLYSPADSLLPTAVSEADSHRKLTDARLKEKVERITETRTRLNRLLEERRDQIASGKLQKAALSAQVENHARSRVAGFRRRGLPNTGRKVERIDRPGGEDANLVADFGLRRIVVMTEAKDHNASSATIQLALAAKARHNCDSCAVVINRRFTVPPRILLVIMAPAIGTGEFPDFVMGKIEL